MNIPNIQIPSFPVTSLPDKASEKMSSETPFLRQKKSMITKSLIMQRLASALLLCLLVTAFSVSVPAASKSVYVKSTPATAGKTAKAAATGKSAPSYSYITKAINVTGGIKLTWTRSNNASGYLVYRAYRDDSSFKTIKTIKKASTTSYIDKNVVSGKEYCYSVIAFHKSGSRYEYAAHNVDGTYIYRLPRPTVSVQDTSNGITVKWSKVTGAGGYLVYRKLSGASKYTRIKKITKGSTLTYKDTSAVAGKTYTYTVRAYRIGTDIYKNRVISYGAYNTAGSTIRHASKSAPSTAGVTYRALLICQSKYDAYTYDLTRPYDIVSNNLYGPYYDGKVMQAMLQGMHYSVNLRNDCKKTEVLNQIRSTFSNADSNDVSLFYFSGHGYTEHDSVYSGCLSMVGSNSYDDELTLGELAAALKTIPGRIVILLDSCGSGAAISSATGSVGAASLGDGGTDAVDGQEEDASVSFNPYVFNQSVIAAFSGETVSVSSGSGETAAAPKYRELISGNKFYVITGARVHELSQDLFIGGLWGSSFTRGLVNGAGYTHGSTTWNGSMEADTDFNNAITLEEAYLFAQKRVKYLNSKIDGGIAQTVLRYPQGSSMVIYQR